MYVYMYNGRYRISQKHSVDRLSMSGLAVERDFTWWRGSDVAGNRGLESNYREIRYNVRCVYLEHFHVVVD